jgi:hypothetical protein
MPWLVAALWKVPATDAAAGALLDAAAAVPEDSPAFSTVAVLRARLLVHRGERDRARQLLATLPTSVGTQRQRGNAEPDRRGADDGLRRRWTSFSTVRRERSSSTGVQQVKAADGRLGWARRVYDEPSFDDDAGAVFDRRLPLNRLVDAASSRSAAAAGSARDLPPPRSPEPSSIRRPDAALRVAPVLRELAPSLGADLARYASAPDDEARHRAGILLLLRTPGMAATVQGMDNDLTYEIAAPARRFNHQFGNWWCPESPRSEFIVIDLLYRDRSVPVPAFVSERIAPRWNGKSRRCGRRARRRPT